MKNPSFTKRLMACAGCRRGKRFEIFGDSTEYVFSRLVDLVTEASVAIYDSDIESDVSTCLFLVYSRRMIPEVS